MADDVASGAVLAAQKTAAVRESIDLKEKDAIEYWRNRKEKVDKDIEELEGRMAEYRRALEEVERRINEGGLKGRDMEEDKILNELHVGAALPDSAISQERLASQLRLLEVFGSCEATIEDDGTSTLTWAASLSTGAALWINAKRKAEIRHPYLAEGLELVKSHPMIKQVVGPQVKRWRMLGIGTVDHEIGWGTCTLRLKGDYGACDVHLAGTPLRRKKQESQGEDEDDLQDMIDEFDIRGSGFSYYWENPWEIKFAIINGFWRGVRATKACGVYMKNAITKTKEELEHIAAEEAEPPQPWGCDIVLVHPTNLREKLCSVAGDPMGHPYFEVFLGRTRRAKDEYSLYCLNLGPRRRRDGPKANHILINVSVRKYPCYHDKLLQTSEDSRRHRVHVDDPRRDKKDYADAESDESIPPVTLLF
ncbi:hypothetical protein FOL47_006833 [Perkinsus chesapeaki]|uniref:Uncharacterized protein n=1 Tax=Perkinsus chesapeaki TaxID=330153 RepID=A0A7J6MWP0_PERCH|nr:hypothetical protein FOL47_006833 [Perkinsus chesapeaki]